MTAILDALLEGTGDLVCLHDREGRFITANEAYSAAVGVPVSSLLGRMPGEVFPGSEAVTAEAASRRALLTGQPVETEEPLGAGVTRRWFSVRRIPYRDSGSRVLGTICISRDVTERHLAFSRLEEQERRFRGLVDAMPLAIWLIDRRQRVMFQNRVHRETFGAAVEGCSCYMALHGGLQACDNCPMDQVVDGETPRRAAWRSPKTDKVFDIHAVPYPARDCEPGVLEILVDVTDRERAESQLRESQRLESLGGLAAGIAHDFNNILAGIIGYAQLGEQRAESMADLQDPFVQIRAVAERGAELTRKILAFSRRQPLKPVPLDLNALVQGLQPMLVPLVHGMVGLRFDLGRHVWAVVADRGQVEQVLFNLCVNAVEAMATGGVLTVTSRNVSAAEMSRALGTEFRGNGVEVAVQDTGQGG
ncbi:MAG: PAS domain-containing protein, partial [Deltaproteobacteria bacterium]|nr:PAS domain-containing protein [Deltaproteobacteria bacterium]